MKRLIKFLPVIALMATPMLAAAITTVSVAQPPAVSLSTATGLVTFLNGVLSVIYTIFFILAAIFIILAAFGYLTAAGDEEKIKTAKNRLIYAIVAIVIALFAVGASTLVANLLNSPTA